MWASKWEKWKDLVPRWENYRDFFHISFFRYLVLWFSLVPVVAKLLESLPQRLFFPYTKTSSLVINLTIPFNWQTLWLSSLLFLAAWIIYIFRCPSLVKKYNNYGDYENYGHDQRWLVWLAVALLKKPRFPILNNDLQLLHERLLTKKYATNVSACEVRGITLCKPIVKEKQTVIFYEHANQYYSFAMPILDATIRDYEKGVFWEIFGRYSGSRLIERLIICLLLSLSALLFATVFFQHVKTGWNYVSKALF